MLEMIISSFIVGFLVAIPPGTLTVVAAQKSILYGFRSSMFFTAGSCISDIFHILIVFFGVAPLLDNSDLFKIFFWYFSSGLLFYFGYDSLLVLKNKNDSGSAPATRKTIAKDILSGIGITLSNPMSITGWLVIAGGYFTHWKDDWPSIHQYGLFSILFIMIGVLFWFVPLMYFISKVKHLVNSSVMKGFVLVSGVFFVCVGLFSIFSATQLLLKVL